MDPQTEQTTEASAAELAAFNAGYEDKPQTTETPSTEQVAEPAQVEPPPTEPAPEYVQLTKQELEDLRSRTAQFAEQATKQQQALDKAFGKIGSVEQDLRSRVTAPVTGEVSDDDFAALKELDPDIARMVAEGLKSASQKLRFQVPEIDPAPIEELIERRVSERLEKQAIESGVKQLNRTHPGWQGLVQNADGSVKPDFVAWLDKQDESFRAEVLAFDMHATSEAIDKFKKDALKAKKDTRTDRLEEAVTPRGTGGPAQSGNSELDGFRQGYREARA